LILSLSSPLALLAHDAFKLRFSDGVRALAVTLAACVVLMVFLRWLTKAWNSAVMLSNQYLILSWSYGHIYGALSGVEILGASIARHRYFIPAWIILHTFGSWLVLRNQSAIDRLMKPVF
jgi:hypothetical protein